MSSNRKTGKFAIFAIYDPCNADYINVNVINNTIASNNSCPFSISDFGFSVFAAPRFFTFFTVKLPFPKTKLELGTWKAT
jgi:hypothetical protein